MHVSRIAIENIRSIRKLIWNLPSARTSGWHVVLGDNGSGKTALLRAIAVALLGPNEAYGLRQDWAKWLRHRCKQGEITLDLVWPHAIDEPPRCDSSSKESNRIDLKLIRSQAGSGKISLRTGKPSPAQQQLWGDEIGGCYGFSASYGAFRRFSGGPSTESAFSENLRRLTRHLSLFDDGFVLEDSLKWWRLWQSEDAFDPSAKPLMAMRDQMKVFLEHFIPFVNKNDLLPASVRLQEFSRTGVSFVDANGVQVSIHDLSDGYRSILSIIFDLILQLMLAFGWDHIFDQDNPSIVKAPGVVLIDEVDAHLHPTWQKRIGFWLCEHFPNIQFIVSTHSPLICQAAVNGSIMLLPRSGSDNKPRLLQREELNRVIYGNVLDAYGTEAFGAEAASTRSTSSEEKHQRLAELNTKELFGKLSEAERKEREELRAALPSAASTLSEK